MVSEMIAETNNVMIQEPWRIEMLGGRRINIPGQEAHSPRRSKQSSLLAYLVYHTHYAHTRDTLVDLFWQEMDLENGQANLRSALTAIRRMLGAPKQNTDRVLYADRHLVHILPEHVKTDVAEFEALFTQGQSQGTQQKALLTRAVDLYAGELLP